MITKEIKQTLLLAWPLFLGLFMIMCGNGLQGTLLGLRATIEGFPVFVTGIVMSLYYAGYFIGCLHYLLTFPGTSGFVVLLQKKPQLGL